MARSSRKNKKYSIELKKAAVEAYLAGEGGLRTICQRYEISDHHVLRNWIACYNGQKENKQPSAARGALYMTKGKQTTQQERAEIVAFCLEHGKDYLQTVKQYGVSYNQIYSWVRKYEEKGIDGLADGKGRTKPESEMTDTEKLQAQVRMLEAQLRDKQMEIDLLKKVKELEGGVWWEK
ncbi:MAG: helix-turn-helix domain-containing protein [Clostridiales bacterium]|nr:helix-turn-helix domain-containing protein [Clostridiales bacterium]